MLLSDKIKAYVSGDKFSTGIESKFICTDEDFILQNRIDLIEKITSGKRVMHIGCVDHDEKTIEHKRERNKWLHERVDRVADKCLGVDINENGIDYMRDDLGYTDVMCVDVLESESPELVSEKWDYILLPEVVEHLDNPVQFLSKLHDKYKKNADSLLITVPAAFTKKNIKHAVRGVEIINSDHRFWFTPYTISKIATNAGFKIEKILMVTGGVIKKRKIFNNYKLKKYPLIRDTIVLIGKF
jgi:2-polyprenyl-3-methyl-5-hydroxy-6-metoxy-1,4-benzoquinol methylase